MASGALKKKSRIVKIGDNLYDYSGGLEEYKNGFVVKQIDGRDDSVEFLNGIKIFAGDVIGAVDENQLPAFSYGRLFSPTSSGSANCSIRALRFCPCSLSTRCRITGNMTQPVSR